MPNRSASGRPSALRLDGGGQRHRELEPPEDRAAREPIVTKYIQVPIYGLRVVRERVERYPVDRLPHARAVVRYAHAAIGTMPQEHLVLIALDARNRIKRTVEVARGGLSGLHVSVGDVLRIALVSGASALVLAHNHPSGDPTPSAEDVAFTKRVAAAATVVSCPLIDHAIVTREAEGWLSMLDAGL